MTYWDLNKFDVEDLMDTLLKKSLAECDYDQTLESYVYHIHDLQLDYLKSQLDGETQETDEKVCETRCSRVKRTLVQSFVIGRVLRLRRNTQWQ